MSEQKPYLLEGDFARLIAKRTGRTICSCVDFTRDFLDTFAEVVGNEQRIKMYGYFTLDYIDIAERDLLTPDGVHSKVVAHKFPRIRISESLYKDNKH